MQQTLPTILIPLGLEGEHAPLDLQQAVRIIFDRAGYESLIDYAKQPDPPLTAAQSEWAAALLQDRIHPPPANR